MLTGEQVQNRRAVEALRAGVPNRDAVSALGCDQPKIERAFRERLQRVKNASWGEGEQSLLIEGDFGSGKSHLLEYLEHVALHENFICSRVVISKETPLYDPRKLYRAAIESATMPNKRGDCLTLVAATLDPKGSEYAELLKAASRDKALDRRFASTLTLFGSGARTDEILDRILRFWSGDPLSVSELRRDLRSCNERIDQSYGPTRIRELAIQRFDFASWLFTAAGYAGWILLVDEVELIGRYSRLQRAKSYAEISRWFDATGTSIVPVFAITEDFKGAILGEKGDRDDITAALEDRWGIDATFLRSVARGMRIVDTKALPLEPVERLDALYDEIRKIYSSAYGYTPPAIAITGKLRSTAIREYIKAWITEWDLKRVDPSYIVNLSVTKLASDYKEEPDL